MVDSAKFSTADSPLPVRKSGTKLFHGFLIYGATNSYYGVINMCSHYGYQILLFITEEVEAIVKLATLKTYSISQTAWSKVWYQFKGASLAL